MAQETVQVRGSADPLGPVHAALALLWAAADRVLPSPPDPTWRGEFSTAVGEISSNIVRHAYPGDAEPAFEFRWRIDRGSVSARFLDHGRPFAAQPPPAPPAPIPDDAVTVILHDVPEGGWGLALARAALDDLSYDREGGENRWLLVKRFRR